MSQSTEEVIETLDESRMLGPRTHLCCCRVDKLVTFCGVEVKAKDNPRPALGALTCAPCVENHEKQICPRFGVCKGHR